METRQFIFAFFAVTGPLALLGLVPRPQPGAARPMPAVVTFAGGCFRPQQEDFSELRGMQR